MTIDNFSAFLDDLRIIFGDSNCPLYKKCSEYDLENTTCASTRGRLDSGIRAPCYDFSKSKITAEKQAQKDSLKNEGLIYNVLNQIWGAD